MASQSAPGLSLQGQGHTSGPVSRPGLSVSFSVVVFAVLLILLSWLHLILAMQTISVGRQIQTANAELDKAKREIAAVQCEIARASAPAKMLERATLAGYVFQQPRFVPLPAAPAESLADPDLRLSQLQPPAISTEAPQSPVFDAAGQLLARLGLSPSQGR